MRHLLLSFLLLLLYHGNLKAMEEDTEVFWKYGGNKKHLDASWISI